MARGSSYGDQPPLHAIPAATQVTIRRATRVLPELHDEEEEFDTEEFDTYVGRDDRNDRLPERRTTTLTLPAFHQPLTRHRSWLIALVLSVVCIVVLFGVVISAGMYQRPGAEQVVPYNGQTFSIQVGGSYNAFNQWENSKGPIVAKTPIPTSTGPYSVLGKPTITADFINRVLASYGSPAAGLGQQMYNLGVQYGIDPVYALAFFMHESLFGTTGEARVTMSLGNLRCIPTRPCIDQNRGGYTQMYSWTDGFEQWFKLIRNLYVAQWGRVTVDQIIPKYAPNSDGNNEAEYIATLKREVDVWHADVLRP